MMTDKLSCLLLEAVKRVGSYNPDETLYSIEELLTAEEYELAESFLSWCNAKGKKFGRGNISAVFKKFQKSNA